MWEGIGINGRCLYRSSWVVEHEYLALKREKERVEIRMQMMTPSSWLPSSQFPIVVSMFCGY